MKRLVLGFVLAWMVSGVGGAQEGPVADLKPTVILISLDGWRWDYHMRYPAPALGRLMARGVRAENLIPSFPSKTFPNHYTVVTGLYPGHHGIVSNNIKDADTGRLFSLSNRREVQDPMWWDGLPLWVTSQRAGQPAAAMFWPGSEAPIQGQWPRFWAPYDEDLPGEDRVDRVLQWLDLPVETRPTFITLYFSDVDTAGHRNGPESAATRNAVLQVDQYLERLVQGLEQRRLLDRVNVVVTSDHGMSATSTDRVVMLDNYISVEDVDIVDINPTLGLFPHAGKEETVYRALAAAHPRLKVYRRADTPPHWHYRDHPRIPPIVGVVDDGWQVLLRTTVIEILAGSRAPSRGEHGYDPGFMSMRGLFAAAGPAFKQGVTVPAFENVHIYNALAQILDVPAAPNDGDASVARLLLR